MDHWELYEKRTDFASLLGKTLVEISGKVGDDELKFVASDGGQYLMYHSQDCCENVRVEDITGDLSDLLGSPLLMAEEVSNADGPPPEYAESYTWTFYKLATIKGGVTIRWLGESNGYYSESVDFAKVA